jgi:hypothetical protein
MKLTKTHLKNLIKEEFSKELKGHLLPLHEADEEAIAAARAQLKGAHEAEALGVRLWDAYDVFGGGDGVDDKKAQEVLHKLEIWAAGGRWDLIKLTADAFNEKEAGPDGDDDGDVIEQTREEDPNETDGDAAKLIKLFRKAEKETVARMAKTSEREKYKQAEFSPEAIEKKAMEKAKGYLSRLNLTPEALKYAADIGRAIGSDKLVQGLKAVLRNIK